jgi:regulator of sirC expression with transglutaminase-like and TPR domain
MSLEPVPEFARLVERGEEVGLAEAALVIARTEYPKLDVAAWLRRLDHLASQVIADPAHPPLGNIEALNDLLFEREEFAGNNEEYDDPRNSYLNDVLERKKGIPITLSLVYVEIARRRALPVVGVGFPGHFLVKYLTGSGEILIDPYFRGAILTPEACSERLRSHFGAESKLKPEYLAAATHKQILARMLNNLKGSYFRRGDYTRVLTMIDLALVIDPGSRQEIHDRGMVRMALKRYGAALADFKTCLDLMPSGDPGAKEVQQAIHRIRGLMN